MQALRVIEQQLKEHSMVDLSHLLCARGRIYKDMYHESGMADEAILERALSNYYGAFELVCVCVRVCLCACACVCVCL